MNKLQKDVNEFLKRLWLYVAQEVAVCWTESIWWVYLVVSERTKVMCRILRT